MILTLARLLIYALIAVTIMIAYSLYYEYEGDKAFNNGNVYAAVDKYSEALRFRDVYYYIQPFTNKTLASLYTRRGNAYMALADYEHAIADYTEAIEFDAGIGRKNAKTLVHRANAYASLGDEAAALEDYNAASEVEPEYYLTYRNRSLIYLKLPDRDCEHAQSDIETYLKLGAIDDQDAQDLVQTFRALCSSPATFGLD